MSDTSHPSGDEDMAPKRKVDRRRPPKEYQFKPGQSGNPNGRPKKQENMHLRLRQVYSEKVTIQDGAGKHRLSRIEILVRKLWAQAISGNLRAAKLSIELASSLKVFDEIEGNRRLNVDWLDEQIRELADKTEPMSLRERLEIASGQKRHAAADSTTSQNQTGTTAQSA